MEDQILAITCHPESRIPDLAKVVPHLPYINTPTSESLFWSTDKLEMRRRITAYNPELTPKYMLVKNTEEETIQKIQKRIGFPLVVKPSGLASSLLVNVVYHTEELNKVLRRTFKRVNKINKEYKEAPAQIIVEQLLEGEMYSLDAYIDNVGNTYFCPMVHIKTGKTIGFDDFFAYRTLTPTQLNEDSINKAHNAAKETIKALGLRSTTAHIEFIRTEGKGWNIVEAGPRIGGFRHNMYNLSFDIDHISNDFLVRIPKKPIIKKRRKGYTSVFKFFAHKEGIITAIKGRKNVQKLESFHSIDMKLEVGDRARYAKNGGKSVFNVTLFNSDRSNLFADIRRMEQMVSIKTE
ncbi:MAG: ATP-grasp domain-containing protein [Candidatus Campbellbacteria bacterium]|nr:ATP-grasp domain-containing protein [Candidatus Campbellbacteria bacterium]